MNKNASSGKHHNAVRLRRAIKTQVTGDSKKSFRTTSLRGETCKSEMSSEGDDNNERDNNCELNDYCEDNNSENDEHRESDGCHGNDDDPEGDDLGGDDPEGGDCPEGGDYSKGRTGRSRSPPAEVRGRRRRRRRVSRRLASREQSLPGFARFALDRPAPSRKRHRRSWHCDAIREALCDAPDDGSETDDDISLEEITGTAWKMFY